MKGNGRKTVDGRIVEWRWGRLWTTILSTCSEERAAGARICSVMCVAQMSRDGDRRDEGVLRRADAEAKGVMTLSLKAMKKGAKPPIAYEKKNSVSENDDATPLPPLDLCLFSQAGEDGTVAQRRQNGISESLWWRPIAHRGRPAGMGGHRISLSRKLAKNGMGKIGTRHGGSTNGVSIEKEEKKRRRHGTKEGSDRRHHLFAPPRHTPAHYTAAHTYIQSPDRQWSDEGEQATRHGILPLRGIALRSVAATDVCLGKRLMRMSVAPAAPLPPLHLGPQALDLQDNIGGVYAAYNGERQGGQPIPNRGRTYSSYVRDSDVHLYSSVITALHSRELSPATSGQLAMVTFFHYLAPLEGNGKFEPGMECCLLVARDNVAGVIFEGREASAEKNYTLARNATSVK